MYDTKEERMRHIEKKFYEDNSPRILNQTQKKESKNRIIVKKENQIRYKSNPRQYQPLSSTDITKIYDGKTIEETQKLKVKQKLRDQMSQLEETKIYSNPSTLKVHKRKNSILVSQKHTENDRN